MSLIHGTWNDSLQIHSMTGLSIDPERGKKGKSSISSSALKHVISSYHKFLINNNIYSSIYTSMI